MLIIKAIRILFYDIVCYFMLFVRDFMLFIARRAYRQATTSKNIRVFASDGGGLLGHSSHRERNNGSRQRRKHYLKEKKIRANTESKKEREQLQRSADVNLLKIQC